MSCAIDPRNAAAHPLHAVEGVVKRAADVVPRRRRRIAGDRAALDPVEAPDIVQPEDVIGVAVREEDRIDALDAGGERLLPEVRRSVDEDRGVTGHIEVDRRAQTRVSRIGRAAHVAGAADHGHAGRGPGTEERDAAGNSGHPSTPLASLMSLRVTPWIARRQGMMMREGSGADPCLLTSM